MMPELPEVEAARKLIEKFCAGKHIEKVYATECGGGPRDGLFDDIVFDDVSEADTIRHLQGRTLVSCHRKGKQQWWMLSGSGPHPCWHFGMTGSFSIKGLKGSEYQRYSVNTDAWPPKFTKARILFHDGTELAFTDPRRLGRVRFVGNPLIEPPVSDLGWDPHLQMRPLSSFAADLSTRSAPIKALLLSQDYVAGIGNWIADEVLYSARIHPDSAACALDGEDVSRLHGAITAVIGHAVSVNAESDKFPKTWLFHFRWGKGKGAAKDAHGNPIEFITVGGRTSAVVRALQGLPKKSTTGKLTKAAAAVMIASSSGGASSSASASADVAAEVQGSSASGVKKPRKRRAAEAAVAADLPARDAGTGELTSSSFSLSSMSFSASLRVGAGASGAGASSSEHSTGYESSLKRRRPAQVLQGPVIGGAATGTNVTTDTSKRRRRATREASDSGNNPAANSSTSAARLGEVIEGSLAIATVRGSTRKIMSIADKNKKP